MPRAPGTSSVRHVALLRGINVGGKNKLPMADLVSLFSEAGCTDVCTYVQSGNVVFRALAAALPKLPGLLARRIEERFGLQVPVVLRSAEQFRRVVAENPFLEAGADPARLHVAFLADLPTRSRAAALDAERSPGDAFELRGRELYLHLPNGVARTRLTNAYFDTVLATTSTLRNWRTVGNLHELLHRTS